MFSPKYLNVPPPITVPVIDANLSLEYSAIAEYETLESRKVKLLEPTVSTTGYNQIQPKKNIDISEFDGPPLDPYVIHEDDMEQLAKVMSNAELSTMAKREQMYTIDERMGKNVKPDNVLMNTASNSNNRNGDNQRKINSLESQVPQTQPPQYLHIPGNSLGTSLSNQPSTPPVLPRRPNASPSKSAKFIEMGFSSDLISLCTSLQSDEKQIINCLVLCQELAEKGFKLSSIEKGLQVYPKDLDRAKSFVTSYSALLEFGFQPEAIKNALICYNNNQEQALERLLNE